MIFYFQDFFCNPHRVPLNIQNVTIIYLIYGAFFTSIFIWYYAYKRRKEHILLQDDLLIENNFSAKEVAPNNHVCMNSAYGTFNLANVSLCSAFSSGLSSLSSYYSASSCTPSRIHSIFPSFRKAPEEYNSLSRALLIDQKECLNNHNNAFSNDKSEQISIGNDKSDTRRNKHINLGEKTKARKNIILQFGFKKSKSGKCFEILLYVLVSFSIFLVLFLFSSEACIGFAESHFLWNIRATSFILIWLLSLFLVFGIRFFREYLHTIFLIQCKLKDSDFVVLYKQDDDAINIENTNDVFSKILLKYRYKVKRLVGLHLSEGWVIFKRKVYCASSSSTKHQITNSRATLPKLQKYFDFQCIRYVYSNIHEKFIPSSGLTQLKERCLSIFSLMENGGLNDSQVEIIRESLGLNKIDVHIPKFMQHLVTEVSDYIFIFQLFLVWKSLYWRSYLTALIWGGLTCFSTIQKILLTRKNQYEIKKLVDSSINQNVVAFRNHCWVATSAQMLVAGDIIQVESDWMVPCDLILAKGEVVLDESNLTGESMPVQKRHVHTELLKKPFSDEEFQNNFHAIRKNHMLFAGTKVLTISGEIKAEEGLKKKNESVKSVDSHTSVRKDCLLRYSFSTISASSLPLISVSSSTSSSTFPLPDASYSLSNSSTKCVGVVISIGAETSKGNLIKNILFPCQLRFKHDEQMPLAFFILSIYAFACIIVQGCFLGWSIATFFYALGTISQILPLWTSVIISMVQNISCRRLAEESKIFCIASSRIAVCGKLRIFCFDKTGTLTKQGMDFIGCQIVDKDELTNKVGFCEYLSFAEKKKKDVKEEKENKFLYEEKKLENFIDSFSIYIKGKKINFEEIQNQENFTRRINLLHGALSSCHSLTCTYSTQKEADQTLPYSSNKFQATTIVGNELEKKMFGITRSRIEEQYDYSNNKLTKHIYPFYSNNNKEIEIIKVFEFDYTKQLMSVIVNCSNLDNNGRSCVIVYCKGSYEKIFNICSDDIPQDYFEKAESYAKEGAYVLSIAYKYVDLCFSNKQQDFDRIYSMSREEVETDLTFLSLILFRNEPKESSKRAIQQLKQGKVRPVIITGDSLLTSIHIAKECKIIEPPPAAFLKNEYGSNLKDKNHSYSSNANYSNNTVGCFITSGDEENKDRNYLSCFPKNNKYGNLQCTDIQFCRNQNEISEIAQVKKSSILIGEMQGGEVFWRDPQSNKFIESSRVYYGSEHCELAITADVFEYLQNEFVNNESNQCLLKSLQNGKNENDVEEDDDEDFNINLDNLYSENRSTTLLDLILMKIRIYARMTPEGKVKVVKFYMSRGYITGMCGDGGNDCGALRAAHAALAFSDAEALIVSPFTSKTKKTTAVTDLIREGRGSLVTSLACYKFMLVYGLLVSSMKLILFGLANAVMPEWGYLYFDNLILLSLSKAMALSKPKSKLHARSPSSSLLGPSTIMAVSLMMIINIFFLFIFYWQLYLSGIEKSGWYNNQTPLYAWWMRSDNYEAPCGCVWMCFQLINGAFIFTFGGMFRRNVFKNRPFMMCWLLLNSGLLFLIFSSPNEITCLFRINCTDEISRKMHFKFLNWFSFTANGMPFYSPLKNNILSFDWKIRIVLICFANIVVNILCSVYIIHGAPAAYFRAKMKDKFSGDLLPV